MHFASLNLKIQYVFTFMCILYDANTGVHDMLGFHISFFHLSKAFLDINDTMFNIETHCFNIFASNFKCISKSYRIMKTRKTYLDLCAYLMIQKKHFLQVSFI